MWTGVHLSGRVTFKKNSYVSRSPVCRTVQSALHVMLLSYYRHACVYFMSVNVTFAVAVHTRKVSRRPCTCPTAGNILILHKPLCVPFLCGCCFDYKLQVSSGRVLRRRTSGHVGLCTRQEVPHLASPRVRPVAYNFFFILFVFPLSCVADG